MSPSSVTILVVPTANFGLDTVRHLTTSWPVTIHTAVADNIPALLKKTAPAVVIAPATQIVPLWPKVYPHATFIGLLGELNTAGELPQLLSGVTYLLPPITAVQLRPYVQPQRDIATLYLRESNRREKAEAFLDLYTSAFNNAQNIIMVIDPQAHLITANRAFWQVHDQLGLTVNPTSQRLHSQADEDSPQWQSLLSRALIGEPFRQEIRTHTHTLALAVNPIISEIDGLTAVVIFAHDLTTRDQTQQSLQATNDQLQAYVEELAALNNIARTVAKVTDLQAALEIVAELMTNLFRARNTGITLLNDQQTTLTVVADFSKSPTEPSPRGLVMPLEGNRSSWLVVKQARSLIINDPQTSDLTVSVHDLMRARHTTSLMIAPLLARGAVIGTIAVDTTDPNRKFTAEEITLLETVAVQIANTIENARLFDEERRMRQQAERQNKDLDAFASTVAHDLKSPMSMVMGFAEMLRDSGATMSAEEIEMMAEQIFIGGRKMISIVEELLVLSSVTREEIETTPVAMSAVLEQALFRLEGLRQAYDGEIIMPSAWPVCLGHAPWVEEVWVNYLSNGIKYGGRPYRLEIGATHQDDGMVCFWVCDNGEGIPLEQIDDIFVEFTRLNQARAQGHGLGLSIVKRIVEKLGGTVGVSCPPPQTSIKGPVEQKSGCYFYFTLPEFDLRQF